MDIRDRARSDLYLAQLRSQSAPNTPGFGPMSPSYSTHMKSPRFPPSAYSKGFDSAGDAEEGNSAYMQPGTRFVEAKPSMAQQAKPFTLQAPPIRVHAATPNSSPGGFEQQQQQDRRIQHAPQAPGEQTYEAVPIPGAYASAKPQRQFEDFPGQAVTAERGIESPPGSPRFHRQ